MKKTIAGTMYVLLTMGFLAACKPAEAPTGPVLENAWIRPVPPGMKMTAGFGTLRNVTGDAMDIEGFSSPALGGISLHLSEVKDGVSSMKEVGVYSLAPGSSLEMKPGSYHLMIMVPVVAPPAGSKVPLHVQTVDGRTFRFEVPVEKH